VVGVRSRPDIYGGRNPGDIPAYSLGEAAHHLRLSLSTVRSWLLGRGYQTRAGARTSPPLIRMVDARSQRLSFNNLVEIHVLSVIRRIHGITAASTRRAISCLQKRLDADHPLLSLPFQTDGRDIFVEEFGEVLNLSRGGQLEFKKLLEAHLRRIERDDAGMPAQLFPFTAGQAEEAPRVVAINPRIQFGRPCIAGTGIPTAVIAERHEAGDPVERLAADYGRSQEEIAEAIQYESRKAA
jgi:uncharacterized protein (DUF433 family)